MKKRNDAFDLLCGLCILRMVSLHVMQFCGHAGDAWWDGVMQWTFFFMSFFFFKAGYFNKSLAGDTRAYLIDKVKRLLVPYITCALLSDVVYFAFLPQMIHLFHKPIEPLHWSRIWDTSEAYGNGPLWFLFSFFSSYVLAHFIDKVRHLHWVVLAFPVIGWWLFSIGNPLWMNLNNIFMGVYFFSLGRVWRMVMERLSRRDIVAFSALLVGFFVVGNIAWHCEYAMRNNIFGGNPFLVVVNVTVVLCGLSGLLMGLKVPRVPWISYIGEHSMVYFVTHYPMLYFYKFVHLSFARSIYGRYDDAIILLITVLCICSWIVPYFEKVPWLSGRWPKASRQDAQPAAESGPSAQ